MTNLNATMKAIRLADLDNIKEVTIEVKDLVELVNKINCDKSTIAIYKKNQDIAECIQAQTKALKVKHFQEYKNV